MNFTQKYNPEETKNTSKCSLNFLTSFTLHFKTKTKPKTQVKLFPTPSKKGYNDNKINILFQLTLCLVFFSLDQQIKKKKLFFYTV